MINGVAANLFIPIGFMIKVRRILYIVLLVLLAVMVQGQDMVYLIHSNTLNFDEKRLPDAQILRGDVIFRHDSALMYCDSAYFFDKQNSLNAFSNVRFVQGDTLFGYGDALYYDGNTKIARIRNNVKLVHFETVLTTDSLNYDRKKDLAYYFNNGKIVDSLNTLTSVWGQYHPRSKQAEFRHDVLLVNPNFTLTSDTLKYNTESHIADIVGPTTIVYEEETTILSTNGQYNTETEQSMLYDRSQVIHDDGKTMTGDTIYYDKKIGFGRVWGNMEMRDSAQMATLYGNYGEMYEEDSRGYATDSALMIDWSDEDNYGYMHADTLFTEDVHYKFIDTLRLDSVVIDTVYKRIRAHHGVRLYRNDMQAVCDSLVYNDLDSVMTLYTEPVCWNENNQMSADSIEIFMKNGTVDYAKGIGAALTVKQETDRYFDQLSGKVMKAYIRDGELRQVDVNGNAETIFYPKEDNGEFIGMNTTQSSNVQIFFVNEEVEHVLFTTESNGVMYPLDQIPPGADELHAFFWATQERPMKPGDVFDNPPRTPRPSSAVVSATAMDKDSQKDLPSSNVQRTLGNKTKHKLQDNEEINDSADTKRNSSRRRGARR